MQQIENSYRTNFRVKKIIRDKMKHYIMIKGSIRKEDTAVLTVNAPNDRVPIYRRKTRKN